MCVPLHVGGGQLGGPLIKKLMSKFAGLSLHYLAGLPVHDVTNSFKLYRKSFLNEVKIESTGGLNSGWNLLLRHLKAVKKLPKFLLSGVTGLQENRILSL